MEGRREVVSVREFVREKKEREREKREERRGRKKQNSKK